MISNLNETAMLEGNAPKRIKMETGVSAVLDRMALSPQADMWPWYVELHLSCEHYKLTNNKRANENLSITISCQCNKVGCPPIKSSGKSGKYTDIFPSGNYT